MKKIGLTLAEAIKSGEKFKRPIHAAFMEMKGNAISYNGVVYTLTREDFIAEDYEIEPLEVTITREKLAEAWDRMAVKNNSLTAVTEDSRIFPMLCKELGL